MRRQAGLEFIYIPLILIALAAMAATATAIPKPEELPSLPRTRHSETAHQAQAWNASTVIAYMAGNGCKPDVFECGETLHYYCADPYNPGNLLGLVVGSRTTVVITGFTARASYWLDKVSGCAHASAP